MEGQLAEFAEAMQAGYGVNPLWGVAALLAIFLIWRVYRYEMKLEERQAAEDRREIEKLFGEK